MDFIILIFATLLPVVVLLVYIYRKYMLSEPNKFPFRCKKSYLCDRFLVF